MNGVYTMLGPAGFGSHRIEDGTAHRVSEPPRGLLIPGFVDIHIHGAFGIDFMSASKAELEILCTKLAEQGYEHFLPTTITSSQEAILKAIENLPENEMISGFHLEGPFISPQFPGAQPPEAIASPPITESKWDPILDHPKLKVVTLAPEIPGALDLISRLSKRSVIVSMGHTNASFDEARYGYEFGARHLTHTFNAMRPFHHREAGIVGYALINDDLRAELIYDRLHVSQDAASVLLKNKPEQHVIAVSDGTAAIGLPRGTKINMWGHDCIVGSGDVRLASNDALAGSAITLLDAFRNLADDFGAECAVRLCCHNPRLALGITEAPKRYVEMNGKGEILNIHQFTEPLRFAV